MSVKGIGYAASFEQFHPTDLLSWSQQAERAGFVGVIASDHFHPWVPSQGHSAFVWSWMGALGATTGLRFGTGVTPPGYRYHQWLAEFVRAGAWWTLEPHPGVALGSRTARCLAHPDGREVLVFAPEGRNVRLTLPDSGRPSGVVAAEWLQPLTGQRAQTTVHLGPRASLQPPWTEDGPFVVRLRQAEA